MKGKKVLKVLQNMYHHYKYGEIVYKSAEGKVIRKKTNTNGFLKKFNENELDTTKTVIDKNGKVEMQIDRYAYFGKDFLMTAFNKIKPNNLNNDIYNVGKGYTIQKDKKEILDIGNIFIIPVTNIYKCPRGKVPKLTTIEKGGKVFTEKVYT